MARTVGLAALIACTVFATTPARTEAGSAQVVDLTTAKKDATAAGKAWLALVDDGRYAESWVRASRLFRQKVSQEQWVAMVKGVRNGLGRLRARSFESASYTETAAGTMVVLLWKSSFDSMPEATEQVTMMMDDGAWRCAGYFVRPR